MVGIGNRIALIFSHRWLGRQRNLLKTWEQLTRTFLRELDRMDRYTLGFNGSSFSRTGRCPIVRTMRSSLTYICTSLFVWLHPAVAFSQTAIGVQGTSFRGTLHDNISNEKRQGSGFNPLILKSQPDVNLFRDDAVGLNFEHIFNGAKAQHAISMFTPRREPCQVRKVGDHRYELRWPSKDSKWGMEAQMTYDLSEPGQVDLHFKCTPMAVDLYSQGFAAMMWASYMNRALDRKIRFWGKDGERVGWVEFGTGTGSKIEVGTIAHADASDLPFEGGAQTLNLVANPKKKFITPFYYGLLDGDHDLETTDDKLLYLVLFDQTESIRFAMWNFFQNESGQPDTHSPAWDWQYVIRNLKAKQSYGYRARVVVKPFKGEEQVWEEYRRWREETKTALPGRPK